METKKEDMEVKARLARIDALTKDIWSVIPDRANAIEVMVALVNVIGRVLSFLEDREEALKIANKIPRAIRGALEILDGKVSDDEVEEE